ncbi:hypothetical protein E1292_39390 [Nonomuraea deserti]|uniref:Uncharacterized protein n=1 Tax=Nonomuraea deserti TaxID=1848322 RepID=A0A4R4USH7_9ACTN|nr:hypothetical protein [Nonomuraea deserti]TDC95297.1 hypothetical protein E1292_39390 [Nonomuraea deserti]
MEFKPLAGVERKHVAALGVAAIMISPGVVLPGSAHAAMRPAAPSAAMIGCSVGGFTDTHDSSPSKVYGGSWLNCRAPSLTPLRLRIRLYRSGTLVDTDICEAPDHSRYCDAAVTVTDRTPGKQRWYSKVTASWDSGSKSFTTNSIRH